jgi:hypothetical protein
MSNNQKDAVVDLLICAVTGTLLAIGACGLGLFCHATTQEIAGMAMVAWVVGFLSGGSLLK